MAVPILGQKKPKDLEIRLLHCLVCDTIEELPPYEGPEELDYLLQIAVEPHKFESGLEHVGKLFSIPLKAWANPEAKKEVIRQIKGGGSAGLAEFDDTYYDTRSTFMEEAMKCYRAHNKPKDGCVDWERSDKRLVPQTHKQRKELGMEKPEDAPGPKTYLCQFCPVAVGVAQRKRKLLGLD